MGAQLMIQNHTKQTKLSSLEEPAVEINGLLRYITCREKGNLCLVMRVCTTISPGWAHEGRQYTHGHDLLRQGSYSAVWETMRGG